MSTRSRNGAIALGALALVLVLVAVVMRGRDTGTTTAASGAGNGTTSSVPVSTTTAVGDGAPTATSVVGPAPETASAVPVDPAVPPSSSAPPTTTPPTTGPKVKAPPTTAAMPLNVQVSPASGLGNGSDVTIRVAPTSGSKIFGFEARLCKAGVDYVNEADFDPTITGKCASKPLSPSSEEYKEVPAKPPFSALDATFKVGVGSDTFKTEQGAPATVTCGPGSPCVLVLKLQFPDGFAFRSYPVNFG